MADRQVNRQTDNYGENLDESTKLQPDKQTKDLDIIWLIYPYLMNC